MEQRTSTWRMTVNEKKFIETALLADIRIDGRRPFDYRQIKIKFGKEDGSSEVELGQTHVMGFVTAQLTQPYRERPNEGSLSIFTEFSPMADPSFEVGRPGESAVELGRIIDRGLRESRAVDTESLCVLAGSLVWAIRVDIHIIDNGGNLVDAANIAALAALMTFRRPECTLGGDNGLEVTVHPPEVKDPLPLIIHHLPIAVTFAFLGDDNIPIIDPSHNEEAVMGGRMTATLNVNGEVCAIQKAGGAGVIQSVVMQCLRIASLKAADITTKINDAVHTYTKERAQSMINRHPTGAPVAVGVTVPDSQMRESSIPQISEVAVNGSEGEATKSKKKKGSKSKGGKKLGGVPSSWDPYTTGIDSDFHKTSLASPETVLVNEGDDRKLETVKLDESGLDFGNRSCVGNDLSGVKTLKDAVKPKSKRKKKTASD